MAFKIKPLNDRIVVKPNAAEEKTQGGIYLPTKTDEKVLQGEVMSVGNGKITSNGRQEMTVKVGEQVVFNQYSATEVEYAGENYMVLREDDIVAVIE